MKKTSIIGIAAALLLTTTSTTWAQDPLGPVPKVNLAFNRLYDYPELVQAMRDLTRAHPDLLTMSSIGKSVEGRDLWCVTVTNRKTGLDRDKPAIYADGNVHGNEVQAAEACLYLIVYLVENANRVAKIREMLDERTFYIVPTVNPDGRAHWFKGLNTTNSSRSGKKPRDDDKDGLFDEDGYDDLNGDGQITFMRKKTTKGSVRLSPTDPRLMVPVGPGEPGEYEVLGYEGIDNDGDGSINEDPPGGYDMNRNYPAGWQPDHVQFGAGPYPLCWPETKAVADFVLDHPNIAGVQSFHNAGGMILRGPGHPTRQDQYPPEDDRIANEIGETGAKMMPGYRNMVIHRDLYPVHGGFVTWTYESLGIFSYTNEIWNNDALLTGGVKSSADELFAVDRLFQGANYVDWKPAKHPKYGDIEIGGFVKQTQRVPPTFLLEECCHRNAAFVLYQADQMPRIIWDEVKTESLGNQTTAITVSVKNTRKIPSRSRQAIKRNIGRPDILSINAPADPKALKILAGGIVIDENNAQDGERVQLAERDSANLKLPNGVPGNNRVQVRWFVQGQGELTIRYSSRQAGSLVQTIKIP